MSRFSYDPNARMPWGHRHRVQEEVYFCIGGRKPKGGDTERFEDFWD